MTDKPDISRRSVALLPIPGSTALVWLNLGLSFVVAVIGLGIGFAQDILSAQQIILFTVVLAIITFILLNYIAVAFETRAAADGARTEEQRGADSSRARALWRENRVLIIAMVALLILYLLISAGVPAFRSVKNLIGFLVLELILLFAFKVSGYFAAGRSAFIGLIVLLALIIISSFSIEGFLSAPNIRAILLFAAFLGIASVGQTLVALMGGLDLSIPFVIGSSNIALLFLITLGVPSYVAFGFILVLGGIVGLINGIISFRLQGQALIVTLVHKLLT